MTRSTLTLIAGLVVLAVAPRVSAEESHARVYESAGSPVELTLVQIGPASANRFVAAVRGLADPQKDGILLVETQRLGGEQRTYTGVGGVGSFWLEDFGHQTLVSGTLMRTLDVAVQGAPAVSLVLSKEKSARADAAALLREYERAQGEAEPATSQAELTAAIQAAVAAEVAVCGGSGPEVRVDWSSFQKAGSVAQVGAATRLLQALQDLCGDAAYRAVIVKLGTVDVTAAPAQAFSLHGPALHVSLGATLENVRLCARKWLKANL